MTIVPNVESALKEFGDAVGMPDLALDQEGRVALVFDGIPVSLIYVEDPIPLLWIYADLGELAENKEPAIWLLRKGFATWLTNQMSIGLDNSNRQILGHTVIAGSAVDRELLESTIDQLLAAAQLVRQAISTSVFPPVTGKAHFAI